MPFHATRCALFAIVVGWCTVVSAEDPALSESNSALLSRIDSLEARLAQHEQAAATQSNWRPAPIADVWYSGGEMVFLRAANSDGDYNAIHQVAPGFRVWAGFQTESGLGARMQFFDYNQSASTTNSVKIHNYDAEITDGLALGNWIILVSGGARFTEFFYGDASRFSGAGPTIGAQATRPLFGDLSLFAGARESLLMGTYSSFGSGSRIPSTVSEMQLGLQYNWGQFLFRGGFESQSYTNIADGPWGENAGFLGIFTSAGFQF